MVKRGKLATAYLHEVAIQDEKDCWFLFVINRMIEKSFQWAVLIKNITGFILGFEKLYHFQ